MTDEARGEWASVLKTPRFEREAPPVSAVLPDWERVQANGLRMLAWTSTPELSRVPEVDREPLLQTCAATLDRVFYRHGLFQQYVDGALRRFEAISHPGEVLMYQSVAKAITFEATDLLVAARSFVDQVVYIAARRSGEPHSRADKWAVSAILQSADVARQKRLRMPSEHVSSEEIRLLDVRFRAWFDDLNIYRNALVHRGDRSNACAYYPPASEKYGADNHTANVMLIPDSGSLRGGNPRSNRWTYKDRRRLEELVLGIYEGCLAFAAELVAMWGGTIPTSTGSYGKRGGVKLIAAVPPAAK